MIAPASGFVTSEHGCAVAASRTAAWALVGLPLGAEAPPLLADLCACLEDAEHPNETANMTAPTRMVVTRKRPSVDGLRDQIMGRYIHRTAETATGPSRI
jgi:hypothetical protein